MQWNTHGKGTHKAHTHKAHTHTQGTHKAKAVSCRQREPRQEDRCGTRNTGQSVRHTEAQSCINGNNNTQTEQFVIDLGRSRVVLWGAVSVGHPPNQLAATSQKVAVRATLLVLVLAGSSSPHDVMATAAAAARPPAAAPPLTGHPPDAAPARRPPPARSA